MKGIWIIVHKTFHHNYTLTKFCKEKGESIMSVISSILDYNKTFVDQNKYERFQTTKYPDKKIVIITCMDTRLLELLPKAMGLRNGDA